MKKILIADDDAVLRAALTRYLQKRDFCVCEAVSGRAALELFQQELPDLIVSDVIMPEMDGFEFCRQVRSCREGQLIPFLFLSSRGEVEARVQGYVLGGDDYLIKPFEPRELLAKIESQLERSRRINAEIVRVMQLSRSHPSVTGGVLSEPPLTPVAPPQTLPLTPAEERVFREVIQGYTNRQVGERLFISPRTVQTHLSNIMGKLKVENRAQLVRLAFEQGYRVDAEPEQSESGGDMSLG
jgi:DNA-binding NarL/FixJ family response regulator